MSFFNTISKNDVVFLTPLIVATAPLSLPYILLCKTQGRSVNTFDNRNREVCVFLLLFVASAIGEVARSDGGVKPDNQKNSYAIFSTPLLRNFVPSVSPLYRYATQGRRLNSSRSLQKHQTIKKKVHPLLRRTP